MCRERPDHMRHQGEFDPQLEAAYTHSSSSSASDLPSSNLGFQSVPRHRSGTSPLADRSYLGTVFQQFIP